MQRLLYKSVNRATATEAGVTSVDLDVDGVVTPLGTVTNFAKTDSFTAILADGTELGSHNTKKQAGGALKKHYDGGAATKTVAPVVAPVAPVVAPAAPETVAEKKAVEIPPMRPVVEASAEEQAKKEAVTNKLLEIPAFLRRTKKKLRFGFGAGNVIGKRQIETSV